MNRLKLLLFSMAAAGAGAAIAALPGPSVPSYSADGVVTVRTFQLPPSSFASKDAADLLKARAAARAPAFSLTAEIGEARRKLEATLAPIVAMMRARHPVNIEERTIAGVGARIITPKEGGADSERVLINLHGGAYAMCADACSLLESLPIAAEGRFKVISLAYRMAPEATFPAASEDVTAVYSELLKSYKPSQIGIYGCSAGGGLAAQTAAWLQRRGLPTPGALGIFGSGAGYGGVGDSAWIAAYVDGTSPPPPTRGVAPPAPPYRSYFDKADVKNPLVSPMWHLDVLRAFPPTLLITSTRAADMSPAVFTHSQLLKAGAKSSLIVAEGVGHCYLYMPQLPESQDAYRAIVDFFRSNLR